jgi:branched-chain amino acid transport system substrate-binding protein
VPCGWRPVDPFHPPETPHEDLSTEDPGGCGRRAAGLGVGLADINIGVTLSLTGPASGLGIPVGNQFKLWPQTIAGEKVNLIILDDASDPSKGASNARRFVTDDKVDMIFGGSITTVSVAIAPLALEAKTTQIAISPVGVPPDQERWLFRLPQGFAVMAHPIVEHMKKNGVKTVGFLGYTDAYGELWLKEFTKQGEAAGIKVVAPSASRAATPASRRRR